MIKHITSYFKFGIRLKPIGIVHSSRKEPTDDDWDQESAWIELSDEFSPDALKGLDTFSHVEVIFYFNQVSADKIVHGARRPRGNLSWPETGIFAQRAKNRPNQLGLTICQILKIADRKLFLQGLDAVDGTPVLDIKPWMKEFAPRGALKQPNWATELMVGYWSAQPSSDQRVP